MAEKTEGRWAAEFVLSEANFHRSRDNITIVSGAGVIVPGDVLGKTPGTLAVGTPVVTGAANGAVGTWTVDAGAQVGNYIIRITGAAGATAAFDVERPDGTVEPVPGNVGTAYNGQINGTLADGSTDWGPGMFVTIPVTATAGSETYAKSPLTGTAGTQVAAAIALYGTDATSAAQKISALVRDAEVNGNLLTYDATVDDAAKKATKHTQLAAAGIIVR